MSAYSVKLTASATSDLMVISDFYLSALDDKLADKMIEMIEQGLAKLAVSPERNPVVPELSSISAKRYQQYLCKPFRLIYRIDGQTVYVITILHQQQSIEKALQNRNLQ
jgi:plasmid stabilization system protein ParE